MEVKMKKYSILSPCGILGYGFPEASFLKGMSLHPDAVVVDAGSTDAGPHKLGAGEFFEAGLGYPMSSNQVWAKKPSLKT